MLNPLKQDNKTDSPELLLLKFLLLTYPPWISRLFSQWPSWGLHTFLQLSCFWIR